VIAIPTAQAGDDPDRIGKRSFRMRVFLARGLAFELGTYRLEDGLIVCFEYGFDGLLGVAITRLDALHNGDRSESSGSNEVAHRIWISQLRILDIDSGRLHDAEKLFDLPTFAIEIDDLTGLTYRADNMRGEQPPMDRLAIGGRGCLTDIDQVQGHALGHIRPRGPRPLQRHRTKAHSKGGDTLLAPRRRGNDYFDAARFRQAVDIGEQRARRIVVITLNATILPGAHDQINMTGSRGKLLINVALAIGDDCFAQCLAQKRARARHDIQPSLGFFLAHLARMTIFNRAATLPVPDLGLQRANQLACDLVKHQAYMQQQATRSTASPDRAKAFLLASLASERHFRCVLNNNHLAANHTLRRLRRSGSRHLLRRHSLIVQEALELNLPSSPTSQSTNVGARPFHEGLMQQGPPFCSRRSPNRLRPKSIPLVSATEVMTLSPNHRCTQRIKHEPGAQPECVHTRAFSRGGNLCSEQMRFSGGGVFLLGPYAIGACSLRSLMTRGHDPSRHSAFRCFSTSSAVGRSGLDTPSPQPLSPKGGEGRLSALTRAIFGFAHRFDMGVVPVQFHEVGHSLERRE